MRVILQAGHSAEFPPYHAAGGGAPGEAAWTADLARRIGSRLTAAGIEVAIVGSWLSGQTEYAPPPAMKRDADLFVALHYDAAIYGADNTGCFADRWEYDSPPTAQNSARAIAIWESIYPVAAQIPLRNNRRNVNTFRYYGFRAKTANTPGLLIECGVGQGFDRPKLFGGIEIVADAIASFVLLYLGLGAPIVEGFSDTALSKLGRALWGEVPFSLDTGIGRRYADDLKAGKYRGVPAGGEEDLGDGVVLQRFKKGTTEVVCGYEGGVGAAFAE